MQQQLVVQLPRMLADLQKTLGKLYLASPFLAIYKHTVATLKGLLSGDKKRVWDERCTPTLNQSFQLLFKRLTLVSPNPELPYHLYSNFDEAVSLVALT